MGHVSDILCGIEEALVKIGVALELEKKSLPVLSRHVLRLCWSLRLLKKPGMINLEEVRDQLL